MGYTGYFAEAPHSPDRSCHRRWAIKACLVSLAAAAHRRHRTRLPFNPRGRRVIGAMDEPERKGQAADSLCQGASGRPRRVRNCLSRPPLEREPCSLTPNPPMCADRYRWPRADKKALPKDRLNGFDGVARRRDRSPLVLQPHEVRIQVSANVVCTEARN